MPGQVLLLPRVEGTGLGLSHGYRAMDPVYTGTLGSGTQGHRTQNMKHGTWLMSKRMDKWAQSHRPEEHPASAGHMDTMVVSYGPQGTQNTMGHMDSMATGHREQA